MVGRRSRGSYNWKRQAYQTWLMTNSSEGRKQYARLNREVKRSILKAKNVAWEIKCDEIDTCMGSSQGRPRK